MIDAALLLLRSVTGGLLAGHGAQKLFGAFEGPGLQGTAGFMKMLRMHPPQLWGTLAGATEFAGGSLTALGFLYPVGPIVSIGPMITATTTAHWGKPIWATRGGAELPVINAAAFGALALTGPGRYSLDALLGIKLPRWVGIATAAGVAGGTAVAMVTRRPEEPQPASAEQPVERELAGAPEARTPQEQPQEQPQQA
jgi:putative oxidoreductase